MGEPEKTIDKTLLNTVLHMDNAGFSALQKQTQQSKQALEAMFDVIDALSREEQK